MQKIVEVQKSTISSYQLFDFGKAAYGTLEVELSADFDHLVEVVIGESCANGTILHEHGWRTFILNRINIRKGTHTYRFEIPDFIPAYSVYPYLATPLECGGEIAPFRYVEINHYYGEATVRRTVWHDDWNDSASHFESSDPELNKIWEFCKYSIKATNVFGCYIDGDRERQPYEGDAFINQLGHFCCDSNYNTARNTIDFFEDHPTWPVEWRLLTPLLIRDYLYYSGNRASVDRWLKWLPERLLASLEVENGLIAGNDKIRDIVDWPQEERDGYVFGKINFVPNAYRCGALQAMYELTADPKWLKQSQLLREQLRKSMWNNTLLPQDSPGADHTAVHSAIFALYFGIANAEETQLLSDYLTQKGMICSVYCAQYYLEACGRYGSGKHLLQCLTGYGERSWNNMLQKGSTISMEGWGKNPMQDWTHAWGAAPANIIPRFIAGIRPTAPGFKTFLLDPTDAGLEHFTMKHPTPNGAIEVVYSKGNGYELTVPEGSAGIVGGKEFLPGRHHIADMIF
ncbi:MAG: hypothetical protein J6W81_00050 [Lentisphaeria bacterium]|nr:hypothetical protein [Lentisphaeria bacterium]